MSDILSLADKNSTHITASRVIKSDLVPWFLSALLCMGIFLGIVAITSQVVGRAHSFEFAAAAIYQQSLVIYALIVGGCFLATRSKGVWTWVLALILCLFISPQGHYTLAVSLLPNTILSSMVAMVGFLALGRILEYLYMRLKMKIVEPSMTVGAWTAYGIVLVVTITISFLPA